MTRGLVGVVSFLGLSCAHNVAQDKATTADGKITGAKPLTLENNEAKDDGIVTYPGGDRVDWKVIELPEKKKGTLEITLKWTPPRPGLRLAFDVFDEWNHPVNLKNPGKQVRLRTGNVENAKGKYFIRVYAMRRGDAGRYKLAVEFKEGAVAGGGIDWAKVPINDPPKLADLPGIIVPCDPLSPDLKSDECRKICFPNAPPKWPGCAGTCTSTPPDPNDPICQRDAPCPSPPDRHFKKCPKIVFGKCKDPKNPDPANPNCDGVTVPPIATRFTSKTKIGDEYEIVMSIGKDSGIGDDWTATLLKGDGTPLPNGTIRIIRVDKTSVTGRVKLTADVLDQNKNVRLSPPPAPKP